MEFINDPYDDVREDVDRLFKEAEGLRTRLKELSAPGPRKAPEEEVEWVLRELAPCLADLDENLAQPELAAAVTIAEKQRATFKVDAEELGRRKDWLQSSKGKLLELNTSLQQLVGVVKKADLWESLKQRVMMAHGKVPPPPPNAKDPVASIRANLDVGSSSKPDAKGKATEKDFEAHNDPYQVHEKMVTEQLELQQMQLAQQDDDLDALHGTIKRLGQVGIAIREELGQQAVLLDELDEETGALQSKLRMVQKKMDKVAADMSTKSKLCVILVLAGILLLLLLVLLYT